MSIYEYDEEEHMRMEREASRAEGREEGREEGIVALILDNMEEGESEEQIAGKLIRRFALSEAEARNYLEKVKNSNAIT